MPARLSYAQEGLWIAERLRSGGCNHVAFAGLLEGPLDYVALDRALQYIGELHPVLLGGVQSTSGVPQQMVEPGARLRLEVIAVADSECGDDDSLARLAQAAAAAPFDLEHGPLARVRVIRLHDETHMLVIAAHHLAVDGWSMVTLLSELGAGYVSQTSAARPPDRTSPFAGQEGLRFGDFAALQRDGASSRDWKADLAYWREQLSDLEILRLPRDYAEPSDSRPEPGWRAVEIPAELSAGLSAVARAERATLFAVVLTSLQLALHRWTGHPDIIIGCPTANRSEGTDGLVGVIANLLLMRADLSDDPSFRALLGRTKRSLFEALDHQDIPFEHLARELRLPGTATGNELFPLGFTWESWPSQASLGGIPMRRVEFGVGTPLRSIELYLREERGVIRGRVEFDPERVSPAIVIRLTDCWYRLIAGVLSSPDLPGSALPFVSPSDKRKQYTWSGRDVQLCDATIIERFVSWARDTPFALAVAGDSRTLTYGQLHAASDRLAAHLRALGIRPGAIAAVLLPRSPEFVTAILAVLKAGGAYLPLDPALPQERLRLMLADADAAVVITDRNHLPNPAMIGIAAIDIADDNSPMTGNDGAIGKDHPSGEDSGEDLAYVIYTSGSAGTPKAVMIGHRSLANLCSWHQRVYCVGPADRGSQVANPAFDAAGWEIWPYLSAGASIHIMPDAVRADPAALVTWLADTEITVCFLPTPLAEAVLGEPGLTGVPLRLMLTGGDRLTRRRPAGSPFRLVNNYGPTEATVVTTWEIVPDDGKEPGPPAIGRPIDNCIIRICDRSRQLIPIGAPGELYIGGPVLAAGYLGRPDLTAQHFIDDLDGNRFYRTGDRVRFREDGRLEFLGRLDRQVKVHGIRIEPAEVEALLSQHPSITQTVVDQLDGRLVAWVIPRSGLTVTGKELRDWLARRYPSGQIPTQWVFMPELPVTANGKRDSGALADAARQSALAPSGGRSVLSPTEAALAASWCEALALNSVEPDDDFFELGGDSLAAINVVALARRRGLALDARDVLHHRRLRDLAAAIGPIGPIATVVQAAGASVNARADIAGPVPLMPCQQDLLIRGRMSSYQWNNCLLVNVDEALDPGLLAEVATLLTDRHDSLRLRFAYTEKGWTQTVRQADGGYGTIVHRLNLSDRPSETWRQVIGETATALSNARDLANGPLLDLVSVDTGSGQSSYLLACVHHLAVDAMSFSILLNDLFAAYRQIRDGQPVDLPSPTLPWASWARLTFEAAHAARVRGQETYWREQCRPGANLPYDHDTGPLQNGSNEHRSIVLDAGESRRLMSSAVPVQQVLLTAIAMAFAEPGGGCVVVDVKDHGRRILDGEADLSWTMGWFSGVYPVRLPVDPAPPHELFTEIGQRIAEVPDHGLGYSLLRYVTDGGLPGLTSAPILLNYLGRLMASPPAGVNSLPRRVTVDRDGRVASTNPVQVSASIQGNQLFLDCYFSRNRFRIPTIDAMAERIAAALHSLIDGEFLKGQGKTVDQKSHWWSA